jgi:hypothetical protein
MPFAPEGGIENHVVGVAGCGLPVVGRAFQAATNPQPATRCQTQKERGLLETAC